MSIRFLFVHFLTRMAPSPNSANHYFSNFSKFRFHVLNNSSRLRVTTCCSVDNSLRINMRVLFRKMRRMPGSLNILVNSCLFMYLYTIDILVFPSCLLKVCRYIKILPFVACCKKRIDLRFFV